MEGWRFHFIDDSVIGYWFTYGPKDHQGGIFTQRWFMLQGAPDALAIYEVQGGRWLFYDDVEVKLVGTATLAVTDTDHMTLRYDLAAGPGNTGEGMLDLSRLF